LGVVVDYETRNRIDTGSYRIPMAVQFVFPVVLVPGLLWFAPESPRWLLENKGPESAHKALRQLNGKRMDEEVLRSELAVMELSLEVENSLNRQSSWRELFTWGPEGRKAYLGFALQGSCSPVNF